MLLHTSGTPATGSISTGYGQTEPGCAVYIFALCQDATIAFLEGYNNVACTQAPLVIAFVSLHQVADGMEVGKEDSDEEKVAALSAVISVGETVFVKVVEIKEDDGSGRYKLGQQLFTLGV